MSEKRPTLVLTGATGFIGKHLADYFLAHNWTVVALVRIAPEKHSRNILYTKYDLASGEPVHLPDEIDAFIHAGYIKQTNGIDAFELNTKSTTHLLETLRKKNVTSKIFLSSLSADENASSVYGRQKAAIEELFLSEKGTVIRAGLVLGNGGLFGAMKNYLKQKSLIPLFGSGAQPLQTVYIDDLVSSIAEIISRNLKGKLVVAVDEPVAYRTFYTELAKSLGAEAKFKRFPYWFAGLAISIATMLKMKLPITKDNLLGLQQMKHIPSAGDLKKIGVKLRDYKESFSNLR